MKATQETFTKANLKYKLKNKNIQTCNGFWMVSKFENKPQFVVLQFF